MRSIISVKVAFWLTPNPAPNRHMPAITATGEESAIMVIMPAAAMTSAGTSSRA
jgi:hypothetical protein